GPGDHQHPHRRIGGEAGEHPGQRRPHRRGHGVALGRPVDGEDGDRAAPLDGQVLDTEVPDREVLSAHPSWSVPKVSHCAEPLVGPVTPDCTWDSVPSRSCTWWPYSWART